MDIIRFYTAGRVLDTASKKIIAYILADSRSFTFNVIRKKEIMRMLNSGEDVRGLTIDEGYLVETEPYATNIRSVYTNSLELIDMPAKLTGRYREYIRSDRNIIDNDNIVDSVAIYEDESSVLCLTDIGTVKLRRKKENVVDFINQNKDKSLVDTIWYSVDSTEMNKSLALLGYGSDSIGPFGSIRVKMGSNHKFTVPTDCKIITGIIGGDRDAEVTIASGCDLISQTVKASEKGAGSVSIHGIGNVRVIGNFLAQERISGNVVFSENCETILTGVFRDTWRIKSIDFSKSKVKILPEEAFSRSGITQADLRGIVELGTEALGQCKNLKKVIVDNKLAYVGKLAFAESAITEIKFGNALEKLGLGAFDLCTELRKVELGNRLREIQRETFSKCLDLECIDTSNISVLGQEAFYGCRSLDTLDFQNVKMAEKNILTGAIVNRVILGKLEPETLANIISHSGIKELILPRENIQTATLLPCNIKKITALEDWA